MRVQSFAPNVSHRCRILLVLKLQHITPQFFLFCGSPRTFPFSQLPTRTSTEFTIMRQTADEIKYNTYEMSEKIYWQRELKESQRQLTWIIYCTTDFGQFIHKCSEQTKKQTSHSEIIHESQSSSTDNSVQMQLIITVFQCHCR